MWVTFIKNYNIWLFQKVSKNQNVFGKKLFDNFIEHLQLKVVWEGG